MSLSHDSMSRSLLQAGRLLVALLFPLGCGVQELPHPPVQDVPAASAGAGGAAEGGTGGGAYPATGGAGPAGAGGSGGAAGSSAASGGRGGGQGGSPGDSGSAPAPPPPDARVDPPASGEGIMIGGRFVPKEKVIVVLHIGHSNMAGRATGPAELKPFFYDTNPQLWVYGKNAALKPAQEPTAPDNQAGQAAGPGMALLHAALAAAPDAQILSIGHGHSGSFAGYCSNFRKGGLFYDLVMKPALELKGKVTFAGVFTMFGQSEHNASASAQKSFADCLVGIATDVRGDLGEADLPFMVGDYEAGISRADIAPDSAFAVPIIAQIKMVPDKTTRAAIIPTDGLAMEDNHHFNMAGHKLWAERAIQILIDRGWAPWAAKK